MLMDNEEFYNEIREKIINKMNQTKIEEDVTSEI